MKLKVWNSDKEVDLVVNIAAQADSTGISFEAVQESGSPFRCGLLFRLTSDGLYLFTDVNPDLGFTLDESGRIQIIGG